jgi:hypothetical protein
MKKSAKNHFRLGTRFCMAAAFFLFISANSFGQLKDTAKIKYPNVAKISISSWLLYPNSFHVGYERVLN